MLPKSKRLTQSDFKGLRTRISYRGTYFDIAVMPATTTKYACIIAKKRVKRAVDRNKARRKVYEAVRSIEPSSPSYVVIYPTKQAVAGAMEAMKNELLAAFATL